jgi:hypothetical protein
MDTSGCKTGTCSNEWYKTVEGTPQGAESYLSTLRLDLQMKLIRIQTNATASDPRQEPYAVVPHVRICAGGGGQPPSLPRLSVKAGNNDGCYKHGNA